ncbi:MAG: DHH family phosphoesterase [Eubacteriales bacterium]
MTLHDLQPYEQITIQCHDNPDADAIGAGFALYEYFTKKEKTVRLIYSGRNAIQKTNLLLMLEHLAIPIEHVISSDEPIKGLLLTIDCQYGAGNVTRLQADAVAIIDHHQMEIENVELCEIRSNLGSCSTLVWDMMKQEGYDFQGQTGVGTALFYGLFTDTNQFSEIYNPLDMDMRDDVTCNKSLVTLFRNSNLSLKELEIAGIALIRFIFNEDYQYAIIKAQPCDPNLLGLISDFLLQVDSVSTCIVYNELEDGYKLSVRSCSKEVRASELAKYVTSGVGSGGGHLEKAGGFISKQQYIHKYKSLHSEAYFSERMNSYFQESQIIYAKEYEIDTSCMQRYRKKKIPLGFVKTIDLGMVGTPLTVRTLEGDLDIRVDEQIYIMIGLKGEVYPIQCHKFQASYEVLDRAYDLDIEYVPTVRRQQDGTSQNILCYAKSCVPTGEIHILARQLENVVKIFTLWDEEKYMLGKVGDYIAVRMDDAHDIYVVEQGVFQKTYETIERESYKGDKS